MNKNSKIYLAGHRGMVGSAIERLLEREGYTNVITRTHAEVDLTRQADVESFFEAEQPEYVIIAAARVGGIMANSTYTADFIYQNIMIAGNIIEASRKYGTKKLINLGSSCIYPKMAPQPLKEEYLLTGPLETTNEAYAVAKIAAIKMCKFYNHQHNTNFISLMPTNMYGMNDNFNLFTSHVLPAMLRKFHLGTLRMAGDYDGIRRDMAVFDYDTGAMEKSDEEINEYCDANMIFSDAVGIWGSGTPMREFMYVDDCAEATLFIMKNFDYGDVGEHVNVGSGKEISIADLAVLIRDTVGYAGEIRYDTLKPDGTPRKVMDVSRIKELGWEAKTGLKEGVNETYRWYLSRYQISS